MFHLLYETWEPKTPLEFEVELSQELSTGFWIICSWGKTGLVSIWGNTIQRVMYFTQESLRLLKKTSRQWSHLSSLKLNNSSDTNWDPSWIIRAEGMWYDVNMASSSDKPHDFKVVLGKLSYCPTLALTHSYKNQSAQPNRHTTAHTSGSSMCFNFNVFDFKNVLRPDPTRIKKWTSLGTYSAPTGLYIQHLMSRKKVKYL